MDKFIEFVNGIINGETKFESIQDVVNFVKGIFDKLFNFVGDKID